MLSLARVVLPQVAEAGRDVARLAQGHAGPLRVAVQCHNCFDWLMPAMDAYRSLWPEVELDIISGFVVDPAAACSIAARRNSPSSTIRRKRTPTWSSARYSAMKALRLMSPRHRLAAKPWLEADGFRRRDPDHLSGARRDAGCDEALPDAGGINPKRRTAELTVAILQLVASGRGIAALPSWTVGNYIERGYVVSRPIGQGACAANCMPRPPAPAPKPPI